MTTALGAGAAATVLFGYSDLRKGMILAWATLLTFCSLFAALGPFGMTGILPVTGMLIYGALAAVSFASILAKDPFTLQYARGMADKSLWENPFFLRVNYLMTGVWGGIFAVNLAVSYLAFIAPDMIGRVASPLTWVVFAVGILFTLWYPGHVQRNHAKAR